MGVEIERKFVVPDTAFLSNVPGAPYRQGYLSADPDRVVRVRRAGDRGYLTVKGRAAGASRPEYEYEIPASDADEMLDRLSVGEVVEKTRHEIEHAGLTWEVDVFEGANAGLSVAEVELSHEEAAVELPDWVGLEVTGDERFYNSSLARRPFESWSAAERAIARSRG